MMSLVILVPMTFMIALNIAMPVLSAKAYMATMSVLTMMTFGSATLEIMCKRNNDSSEENCLLLDQVQRVSAKRFQNEFLVVIINKGFRLFIGTN